MLLLKKPAWLIMSNYSLEAKYTFDFCNRSISLIPYKIKITRGNFISKGGRVFKISGRIIPIKAIHNLRNVSGRNVSQIQILGDKTDIYFFHNHIIFN